MTKHGICWMKFDTKMARFINFSDGFILLDWVETMSRDLNVFMRILEKIEEK